MYECHIQVYLFRNNISIVKLSPKYISLSFTAAIFLIICFMTVL